MTKKMNDEKKPAFEARLNHVRVSVWRNSGDNGEWFNTVITRRYRDGEEWKDSNAFNGLGDIALVSEAVRLARVFIARQELGLDSDEV